MFLLSTDIDGTIYDGPETANAFASFWKSLGNPNGNSPVLAYNTGRSLSDARELVRTTGLPDPDWFICGVGTSIFDPVREVTLQCWLDELSKGWDVAVAREAVSSLTPARPQPPECQSDYKSSWYWDGASNAEIEALAASLMKSGIAAQVVYSSDRDLDLVPVAANKGNAIRYLAALTGVPLRDVIVAGDSGNDASMFQVEGVRGVVVANAEPVLKLVASGSAVYHSKRTCAHGVIEGIENFQRLAGKP